MWLQRSKKKELLEGDSLPHYFIARASGRKRKNRITSFNFIDNVVQGDKDLLDYATSFYKLIWPCY